MTRRSVFMGLGLLAVAANAQDKKPNVIIIYTDDQGTLDMNCFGAPDLSTPNMDRLAQRGVKFTQFYGAAVSSASRAALLTGQFNMHNGLTGNAGYTGLKPEKETIAERLKANGYRTACIGKWHLGSWPEYRPMNQGFDKFWGFLGGCIDSYSHFYYWGGPNQHDLWEGDTEIWRPGKFFAEGTLEQAEKFIDETSDEPFFLYWAVNIPHYPLQPKEKWLDYYKNLPNPRRMYAAFVSTFDDYLGEFLTYLHDKGLDENTIVILQSDNGHSTEVRTFGSGGYCGDYRGAKFSLFEGGIRVPAIISWPGHIPEGVTRTDVAANVDWFPTLMDYCGIDYKDAELDGISLRNMIDGKKMKQKDRVLHFDFDGQWAVRYGDWKLIWDAQDVQKGDKRPTISGIYLTNLAIDSTESSNLADTYPDKVAELQKMRNDFLEKVGAK